MVPNLSSALAAVDGFLDNSGFDRGPWAVVAFGTGIAAWFILPGAREWATVAVLLVMVAVAAQALCLEARGYPFIHQALVALAMAAVAGLAIVWIKSTLVGQAPVARAVIGTFTGRVLNRTEQPAEKRVRLLLATRNPEDGRAIQARVNLPIALDDPGVRETAVVRIKARLMPPPPPLLPGGYDFARAAWFAGLSATGTALGPMQILRPATAQHTLGGIRAKLSSHVRDNVSGSPGAIAAAFASGDRGAIAEADEVAMRDAGLTHLLSISGLHVSALVAAAYLLASRLLALWPWLALRVRVPLVAAATGALAGVGYTVLTGAEVPTVRSYLAALLVLAALALGREPLSMRMVAIAAFVVLVFWPEAVVGPSFQMSFAAVIAIVALHQSAPVKAFLAPREEAWLTRAGRRFAMLLLTGGVIELALMPIGLFHFHRAGVYGALANVVAIPLTTFVSMPLIALALFADIAGAGAPVWWLVGKSLDALLALAHFTARLPGAVTLLPTMDDAAFGLFIAGGVWLALWSGRVRMLGLIPAVIGAISLIGAARPDLLISRDGRHVGIANQGSELLVLHPVGTGFAGESLREIAGMAGEPRVLAEWDQARCNRDFCAAVFTRGGREWNLLLSRGSDYVAERELAAICDRAHIVIADRRLPNSCRPRWLKVDRALLNQSGGLAIDLSRQSVVTVAETQGQHPWWMATNRPSEYSPRAIGKVSAEPNANAMPAN